MGARRGSGLDLLGVEARDERDGKGGRARPKVAIFFFSRFPSRAPGGRSRSRRAACRSVARLRTRTPAHTHPHLTPRLRVRVARDHSPLASPFPPPGGGAGPGPSTSGPARPPPEGLSPRDVHVLLVDDERLARMVVGSLLRKLEYRGAWGVRSLEERERARARGGTRAPSVAGVLGGATWSSPARARPAGAPRCPCRPRTGLGGPPGPLPDRDTHHGRGVGGPAEGLCPPLTCAGLSPLPRPTPAPLSPSFSLSLCSLQSRKPSPASRPSPSYGTRPRARTTWS